MERLEHIGQIVFVCILIVVIVILFRNVVSHKTIANDDAIDVAEIKKSNDSIKIRVDNLDSIKHAKVIEVQKLDNDSTVKLFYKLIK